MRRRGAAPRRASRFVYTVTPSSRIRHFLCGRNAPSATRLNLLGHDSNHHYSREHVRKATATTVAMELFLCEVARHDTIRTLRCQSRCQRYLVTTWKSIALCISVSFPLLLSVS